MFLGLMGLPEDELRMFLRLRDGILQSREARPRRPVRHGQAAAVQDATGQEIYEYFGGLIDERRSTDRRHRRPVSWRPRSTASNSSREDILDILYLFLIAGLDTVSDSLTCFYAFLATHPEHRRQIVENPSIIPSAVEELLRWESPVPSGVPRVATRRHRAAERRRRWRRERRSSSATGRPTSTPAAFTDPFDVRFDRARTRTSRSAAACTDASAATWLGGSYGSPSGSGTGASRTTGSSQVTRSSSTRPDCAT